MAPLLKVNKFHPKYLKKGKCPFPRERRRQLFREEVCAIAKKLEKLDSSRIKTFADFPLSQKTLTGLKDNDYIEPTEIQKESIGLALKGHDILGAARTGSGKTLAFIIPVLELLYVSGWTQDDQLGALIITPTRELAYQIFEVFKKVGAGHNFSCGLVIGGKDIKIERVIMHQCNVVICTPGRLLQHMDENAQFDVMNMKILVLDEADRILDMGFQEALNSILDYLPKERQTLLFSATQTKSIKDLLRLNMKNPMYVSVHEHAKHTTPEALEQSYMVCEAHMKYNLIWSFVKTHPIHKVLVFMATCKQVKFAFETFLKLYTNVSVLALHGGLNQMRRMQVYNEFCNKLRVVMFATDIAARGLDFPNVNWVVQLDCPEDVNTYIHRVGRTARLEKGGEALLVLLPSEEKSMVEQLQKRKIPISEIKVNPLKLQSVNKKLEMLCSRFSDLKDSAQRAYKAYTKNIYMMKDKTVFDITKIDFELYAKSLGLEFAPRNRFLEKRVRGFKERTVPKKEAEVLLTCNASSDESDSECLIPKQSTSQSASEESQSTTKDELALPKIPKKPLTKTAIAKNLLRRKNVLKLQSIVVKFDENGKPIREVCGVRFPDTTADLRNEMASEGYSVGKAQLLLAMEHYTIDRVLFRERLRVRRQREREAKLKEREAKLKELNDGSNSEDDSEGEYERAPVEGGADNEPEEEGLDSEPEEEGLDSEPEEEGLDSEPEEEGLDSEPEEEGLESASQFSGKRKISAVDAKVESKKKLKTAKKKPAQPSTSLSVEEEEELALKLLGGM